MSNNLKYVLVHFLILVSLSAMTQNDLKNDSLPFRDITQYPSSFSSENVLLRMIDGLGFRFYWATEGLRNEDLIYRPNEDARTSEETIDHVMGLSKMVLNSLNSTPNITSGEETSPKSFEEKRKIVLNNLFEARQMLASNLIKVEEVKIIFVRNKTTSELPVWNLINGPIADAIWHTGQIVSFRRSSGNPFDSKVNVMLGKLR